jgi:PAS domain S-box-containing protein
VKKSSPLSVLREENLELRNRLQEAEETLEAIRQGAVDAIVVSSAVGERIFTLTGQDAVYRHLVETMNEGGLTTTPEGQILFCNERFGRMVDRPMETLVGQPVGQFIDPACQNDLDALLVEVHKGPRKKRLVFLHSSSRHVSCSVSASLLPLQDSVSVCLVVTDTTELEATNAESKTRANQLARLAWQLFSTEQRERNRLAQIVNEQLEPQLVALAEELDRLARQPDGPKQPNAIVRLADMIQQAIEESQSLSIEVCPSTLYEEELIEGLEWLARWMDEKYHFKVDLSLDCPVQVRSEPIRILLFQCIRELLLNAVHHSGVSGAQVELKIDPATLSVLVRDAGHGFDVSQMWANSMQMTSFGLLNIRERLRLLGGTLSIQSKPGAGSTFVLTLPWSDEDHLR